MEVYLRELFIPKGCFLVTKLHRDAYFSFLMFGALTVLTETGGAIKEGPCIIPSAAGAKRIAYAHTDFVWATVHPNPTNSTDVQMLEDQIHAESYDELDKIVEMAPEKIDPGKIDSDAEAIIKCFYEHIKETNRARGQLCLD